MPLGEAEIKVKVLPDISEVERFQYKPGDRFILKYSGTIYDMTQAREIGQRFRAVMKLPDDTPVAVIDESWEVMIVERNEEWT